MKDIVKLISEAARVTNEAIPLLRDVKKNGAQLHQLTSASSGWKAKQTISTPRD
jgi:hypothetical protein